MRFNKKGQDYATFCAIEGWSKVRVPITHYQQRRKIPDELRLKRDTHIRKVYNEGTPMSWIAKFYDCSRVHILRIVKG